MLTENCIRSLEILFISVARRPFENYHMLRSPVRMLCGPGGMSRLRVLCPWLRLVRRKCCLLTMAFLSQPAKRWTSWLVFCPLYHRLPEKNMQPSLVSVAIIP